MRLTKKFRRTLLPRDTAINDDAPGYALLLVMLTRVRLAHAAPCEREELVPLEIPLPLPHPSATTAVSN